MVVFECIWLEVKQFSTTSSPDEVRQPFNSISIYSLF
jgi:hypothetical protein